VRLVRWGIPALLLAAAVAVAPAGGKPSLQTTEMGAGGASMVFVHGIGGARTDWLPLVKRLKDRYRLVMVELPGHGSSPLPEPFSLEVAADAVDSVIALQKPESTIVVGQGVGGMLALQALARHPGHARGLVLVDVALKSPMQIDDQQITQVVRFMDENYAAFQQMVFSKMGRDSAESAILYAKMASVQPATVKAYMRHLLRVDANRDLKSLGIPVQAVVTERLWKPGALWGTVSKGMGYEDSTSVVPRRVASAGMLVMKDQPDTLAAILSEYAAARFAANK
jgi:pimeloyl-ACP methyl ester carboxylesterase